MHVNNIKLLLICLLSFDHTVYSGPSMSVNEVHPLQISQRKLRSLLKNAIQKGDSSLVGLIVPHMTLSSINQRDSKGLTPLHYAVADKQNNNNKLIMIQHLIKFGANANKKDAYDITPYELAEASQYPFRKRFDLCESEVAVIKTIYNIVCDA